MRKKEIRHLYEKLSKLVSNYRFLNEGINEGNKKGLCSEGFVQVGMIMEGENEVPNCVPISELVKLKEKVLQEILSLRNNFLTEDTVSIQKTPEGLEQEDPNVQYGDKSSVILNLNALAKKSKKVADITLNEIYRLVDETGKDTEELRLGVQNMVVDLTKMINEFKERKADTDELKELEEMRSTLRYLVTAITNNNKNVREMEDKIEEKRAKIDYDGYERELQLLEEKYGISELKDLEYQKEDLEIDFVDDIYGDVQKMEQEAKDIVRKIRDIVKRGYDIDEKIADTAMIFVKAMGAVARLQKSSQRYSMDKEGIKQILEDEKLNAQFGKFIKITEVSGSVNINGVVLPSLSTYYAQLNTKITEEVRKLEKEKNDKNIKNEGFFGDVYNTVVEMMKDITSKFTKKMSSLFTSSNSKTEQVLKAFENKVKAQEDELDIIIKETKSLILDIEEKTKKMEAEAIHKEKEELK